MVLYDSMQSGKKRTIYYSGFRFSGSGFRFPRQNKIFKNPVPPYPPIVLYGPGPLERCIHYTQ